MNMLTIYRYYVSIKLQTAYWFNKRNYDRIQKQFYLLNIHRLEYSKKIIKQTEQSFGN